jgi:hypothetical protein
MNDGPPAIFGVVLPGFITWVFLRRVKVIGVGLQGLTNPQSTVRGRRQTGQRIQRERMKRM